MLFEIKINVMVDFPKIYLFERVNTYFLVKNQRKSRYGKKILLS